MSKHQLTISPTYVQDWTYIEAVRELFQNALDNQVVDKDNIMYFAYNEEVQELIIGNKTSKLEVNSLLMGYSSKRDDEDTIGRHGEGYKVALMVLLREGKTVTIQNYGKKELWSSRLIKSRKYNGEMITEIDVKKNFIFKTVPHNDLEIIIGGINKEEYENLIKNNLNLQPLIEDEDYYQTSRGKVLLSEKEKGNIYVSGLFVSHNPKLHKGYSLNPREIKLDRDRKLIQDFDLHFACSRLLAELTSTKTEFIAKLVEDDAPEVQYIYSERNTFHTADEDKFLPMVKILAKKFTELHGEDAVPVSSADELEFIQSKTKNKAVLVSQNHKKLIENNFSTRVTELKNPKRRLKDWLKGVESKLSEEEISDFEAILSDIYV